jgi:C1A family cysteine protease
LVSCDPLNSGCSGGVPRAAFEYMMTYGIQTDQQYPYDSSNTKNASQCRFNCTDITNQIKGWRYATKNMNETQMQQILHSYGPLSACVDATTWMFYKDGVIYRDCGTQLNHCVQITGWDVTDKGMPYWIVRNTYGKSWGMDGYIHIAFGKLI